jgi:hypothetical protein
MNRHNLSPVTDTSAIPLCSTQKTRGPFHLLAPVIVAALGLGATTACADNYDVTVGNDDGTGGTNGTLSWAIRQTNVNPNADTITLKTDVTVTGVMKTLIDGAPSGGDHDSGGGDLFIQSDEIRRTISGGGQFRPLFVKSGTVTIHDMDLANGKANGGNSRWGGGGAGLGGALFVSSGSVTVQYVAFNSNNAIGGNGAASGCDDGGGGMFGNGGGNGGGGLFGDSSGDDGGYGGNGNYGGGTASGTSDFGGGGNRGGNGGFGGGGGISGGPTYGLGGFGGGGGYGGNGGFGGGGGATGFTYTGTGFGGNGGGDGNGSSVGGGGAGFGGAIFAMNGTTTLIDVSFSSNSVTAGTGANDGIADAADVFICTSQDSLCGATVNACGTTSTSKIVGAFGSDCPGTTPPEIDITGNDISIADGDTTPDSADHTDFGIAAIGASVSRIYSIANSGGTDLNLTGSGDLVVLDGSGCTEFTVTAQPISPVPSGGGITTFTVEYSPTDVGEDTCTITVENDDDDENPYGFMIKGTGKNGSSFLPAVYLLLL